LENTPHAWLRQLLLCYNSGDMDGFDKITKSGDFLKQVYETELAIISLQFDLFETKIVLDDFDGNCIQTIKRGKRQHVIFSNCN
jgi:hypothetical protein